jgi:hypothetical protein
MGYDVTHRVGELAYWSVPILMLEYVQRMNALLLTDEGPYLNRDYPPPLPSNGEALIRVHLVRPGGTLLLKSTFAGTPLAFDPSKLVVDEMTVVGSRCGPFSPALRLLESGQVQVLPLVQACYPLDEGLAALEHAGRAGMLKVLIAPALM